MWRYLLVLVILAGLAPFVPSLLEPYLTQHVERRSSSEPRDDEAFGGRTHKVTADHRGHFTVQADLNGKRIDMLVDTGATVTALPETVARSIGLFLKKADFKYQVSTANGVTHGAKAVISRLNIGAIYLRQVEAIVLKDESLHEPLLGMNALKKLHKFDISGRTLLLVQ